MSFQDKSLYSLSVMEELIAHAEVAVSELRKAAAGCRQDREWAMQELSLFEQFLERARQSYAVLSEGISGTWTLFDLAQVDADEVHPLAEGGGE